MFKIKFLVVIIFLTTAVSSYAQVGINNTNAAPNSFSMLDVSATQKGILIPRITTANRNNMAGAMGLSEEGLSVYDTDTKSFWFWDGTAWIAMGNGAALSDSDWFKSGTTDTPTDINDTIYHLGKVAVGKNTTNAQLDVYSADQVTLFNGKLENPNDMPLRLGASVDVDGTAITTHGKVGVYTTVGGDPGSASYPVLEGFEAAVIGQAGVDKDQYGIYTYVTGDNAGIHAGLSTYLDGGTTGDRYANYNWIAGSSSGKNFLYYGFDNNSGDGLHFGNFNMLAGTGNGIKYGGFNRIWNSGSGKQFGSFNEIYTKGAAAHTGTLNLLGARVAPENPASISAITGDSAGKRIGTVNTIAGDGGGLHLGESNNIISTGDGFHVAVSNVLGHDYLNNTNTTTAGYHLGLINNLTDTGNGIHAGTVNSLGLILDPNNPTNITAVTGDSDAKRVGEVNTIGGDGGGVHVGEANNIVSTGDGFHVAVSNVLGHNYLVNSNTATAGYQLGILNNITDIGNKAHVGATNILGFVVDPNDPTNIAPVVGDSDAKRVGELNTIGGDGNGQHYGIINSLLSTGTGELVGSSNVMGYDFITQSATNAAGDHVGTLNSLNSTGSGLHYGTVNFLGYDHIHKTEINSDGMHIGTGNLLAGGQSGSALQGLQVGSSNVIIAKSDVSSATSLGMQYGTMNIIGRNPANILGGTTDNGDGNHFAAYNEVTDTGNGMHVASYNKVSADGNGLHVAVYGEVDLANTGAMAGVFKGYTTATNQVSTINLYSAAEYNVMNTTMQNLTYMEAGFDPTLYNQLGNVQVKVVVRVTSSGPSGNEFQLTAQNASGTTTVISNSDTWTWTETDTTNHKYIVTTDWKTWAAGANMLELHLQGKTGSSLKIDNVYIVVRPMQY